MKINYIIKNVCKKQHQNNLTFLTIEAAKRTTLLDQEEKPYILQKKLDDFYIIYELNVFSTQPEAKLEVHSSLNSNILDVFKEAEIEIMSPHYRAERMAQQVQ